MGKHRLHRSYNKRERLDIDNRPDGPGTTELRSLRGGGHSVLSSGKDEGGSGGRPNGHVVSLATGDIRGDSERLRISRRPSSPIRRSFDAGDINPILNDPEVFASVTVPGVDKIDVTEIVNDPRNVLIMSDGGGVLFIQQEPGIYEVHTNFLKAYRGRHAIAVSRDAYRWMFTHTDCVALLTKVPAFNKAAKWFCAFVGATREFDRKAVWPTKNGFVDLSFWALRYPDWVRKTPELIESGKAFHRHLEEELARHGIDEPHHGDEECHDRYVGACAQMVYGGQPEKAVILYNSWARFSGYGQIALLSRNPLVVDIGDAVLQIDDGTFKVVFCRQKSAMVN